MPSDFVQRIYREARKLFPKGQLEIRVARAKGPRSGLADLDGSVQLIHKPTGTKVTCSEFPTQIENFAAAAIRLKIACGKQRH